MSPAERDTYFTLKQEHRRHLHVAHRRITGHDRGSEMFSPVGIAPREAAMELERAAKIRRQLVAMKTGQPWVAWSRL